jgi:hypothetical protein
VPMQLRLQFQQNEVADEVAAVTAVVRPILEGLLYGLKREVAVDAGGYEAIRLRSLPRLYRAGDRDCGICFEYAVHDALNRRDADVLERVHDAVRMCNVQGGEPASILFGLEKTGALNLIDTAMGRLTEESRLLAGNRGQPAQLKRHIDSIASAFRRKAARDTLPDSISGIWKADLFVGYTDSDRWIGTTVKINPSQLEGARGLRVGIVPARGGRNDIIVRDDARNLIVCPLPHDHSFMQVFYQGWGVVQQFVAADAQIPREVALPNPVDRQVARYLFERREHPVVDVLQALVPLAQPELLRTEEQNPTLVNRREDEHDIETGAVVAPLPRAV